MSGMPYRVFLLFNAFGGLVWGVGFTLLGYFAGTAYQRVERTAGTAAAITVAVVAVAALAVWHFRRRRRAGREEAPPGEDGKR
jgi:membrane protein DedA with SNARE-associated domain